MSAASLKSFLQRFKHVRIVMTVLMVAALMAFGTILLAEDDNPDASAPTVAAVPTGMRAGLRASDYGISPFPAPTWWVNSINSMAARFPGSTGSSILVVVEIDGMSGPGCWAHFPNPDGGTYPGVRFADQDEFEPMLAAFDQAGIQAWLQVEPSGCSMPMLIDLVFRNYGQHPSVIGFGVDDEWYLNKSYRVGKPITNAEAQAWVQQVRSYNPAYQVLLKHWLTAQMPPTYRDGIVFVDDSQAFKSLNALVTDFTAWGKYFAPAPVGFQFGYARDRKWWRKLANPPRDIGTAILAKVPNTMDLYWVDFTAYEIWPAN
jgi:hypothetical protein